MSSRHQLILFAKFPEVGRVKTRLAAAIGPEAAARHYRRMVETVVTRTTPPLDGSRYSRLLYFDPPERVADFRAWLPQIADHRPQCGTDLGERMYNAFVECFDSHQRPATSDQRRVCLIGTDCVDIDAQLILMAFDHLATHDIVIGPATDGGYYLLGMRRLIPELFRGMAWSTDRVYQQTMATVDGLRLRAAILPVLSDIDTAEDLR